MFRGAAEKTTEKRPPPPPRPVTPIFGDRPWLFVALIALLLVPCVGVGAASLEYGRRPWDDFYLSKRGKTVEATIVSSNRIQSKKQTILEATMEFTTTDGRRVTARRDTYEPDTIADAADNTIGLEYDPESPERVRFVGESAMGLRGYLGFFLGFGFASLLVGFVAYQVIVGKMRQRLFRDGEVAKATVVEVTDDPKGIGYRIAYDFEAAKNKVRGKAKRASPAKVGDELWVFFDAKRPTRNVPADEGQ